ncbi:MAG: adenylate kinase [Oscillospiraceae bacterium]|jgi:adenylate kinase|nr:adenylate kinase [Oscillospiraceae bacterium]
MNIVLLGAPGAGKGTLAEALEKKLSIPSISTGNVIRKALKSGTEIGNKAKDIVEAGRLLPDDMVVGIMKNELKGDKFKSGFVLDGFPRTVPQAEALDKMQFVIDKVINIDVNDEVIAKRMSGRVVCEDCGSTYHLVNKPPTKKGVCDLCSGKLSRRKDDEPDTVKNRLLIYHEETEPLIDYYKKQGKLAFVDGGGGIEHLVESALSALGC